MSPIDLLAGHSAGLISAERLAKYQSDRDGIQRGTDFLKSIVLSPQVREQLAVINKFFFNQANSIGRDTALL